MDLLTKCYMEGGKCCIEVIRVSNKFMFIKGSLWKTLEEFLSEGFDSELPKSIMCVIFEYITWTTKFCCQYTNGNMSIDDEQFQYLALTNNFTNMNTVTACNKENFRIICGVGDIVVTDHFKFKFLKNSLENKNLRCSYERVFKYLNENAGGAHIINSINNLSEYTYFTVPKLQCGGCMNGFLLIRDDENALHSLQAFNFLIENYKFGEPILKKLTLKVSNKLNQIPNN